MGSSHGGTGEGSGGGVAGVVSGEDARAGSEDVEDGAVVGEGRAGISVGGGTDGDGVGGRGRGVVGGVGVVVTGSDDEGDAVVDGSLDSGVQGRGVRATERHVGDGLLATAVGSDPLNTLNDTGGGTGTVITENLDTDESGLLGNTVGVATDGTGNVGTVTVAVAVGTASDVGTDGGTAAEVVVGGADTGVNNIDSDALAGGGVVDVAGGGAGAVGDTGNAPRSTSLGGLKKAS